MKRDMTSTIGAALMALVWLAGSAAIAEAQAKPAGKTLKNPVATSPESVAAGRVVFQRQCRTCHGASGKGDGTAAPEGSKPANLTDDKWDHGSTDGEIFATIRDGVGPKFDMDAWEGRIKEQDMWNVVNYIRTLGAPKAP